MSTLLKDIGMLLTVQPQAGSTVKTGADMGDLHIIHDAAMIFSDTIEWIGPAADIPKDFIPGQIRSASGNTVLPGWVDSHTHCVFAGSRADEFAMRLRGTSYQEIAAAGGGILKTVKAVRSATVEELAAQGIELALSALAHGTTTMEIKSGYGLSTQSELNLLKAVQMVAAEVPMRFIATFMGAHDIPPEYKHDPDAYVDLICKEMIPAVASGGLATFCDVFTDTGYFTIAQSEKILLAAMDAGMKIKVHADELTPFGAAGMAGRLNAVSADHLLFISDQDMELMQQGGTVATLLPGTAYTLRLPYAPARKMIDAGLIVALATDCNPGSCFSENMQMMLSLAITNMGMNIEQAITAATLHGAAALQLQDTIGSLQIGKAADFQILNCKQYPELVYHFGVNHTAQVWVNGKKVYDILA
jgi:imidazolonepropionase